MDNPMTPISSPTPRHAPVALLEQLRAYFGQRFSTGESVRAQHGRDESPYPAAEPDGVVFAESADDVVTTVKLCGAHDVPLVAYGVGSSLEGHVLALHGGISIDFSGMNRILAIRPEDMDVTVEPGVTRVQLNDALKGTGLFFPIDPGANATLGGMAATRASGTNAVRYGTMRDAVLSLTAVMADGSIVRTGSRARKSSAGYDLTRLLVGSEGTLALTTALTLRLHPLPESIASAACAFPSVAEAVQTVIETIQLGVPIARIEVLDALSVSAINRYSKLDMPVAPTLFFEFHGSPTHTAEQVATVRDLAAAHGGIDFRWADRPEDRTRIWQARHDAYFAGLQLKPGYRSQTTDVCVPISRLAECIAGTEADIADSGLTVPLLGHVGDGNFHLMVLADPENADELERAAALSRAVVERALALDGTCTGEHGVGIGKKKYLTAEHGEVAVDVMQRIKTALDPRNLFNPGKIVG
jgi:D-lactate dehydrogenase (cytochrome)